MSANGKVSWWPDPLLHRHPVSRVYVCGRNLEPPLLSHVVNFPRLEIPLSGCYENQIAVDNRAVTVQLKPGSALFAPPNCGNLLTGRHEVRVMSLLFGQKRLGVSIVTVRNPAGPGPKALKVSQPRPFTGPVPKILDAMVELSAEGRLADALAELARALLACVRAAILQPAISNNDHACSLLDDVCVFLQNHYQYDITRDSVARQFGVSPNYLSRMFQVHGHMTFSSYLMHVRTDRAKHLLRNYNLKLDDVAARCGYRDSAYFCRVFKRVAKDTPAGYRAQYRPSPAARPPAEG